MPVALLLLGLGGLVLALDALFPGVLSDEEALGATIYHVAWIGLLGAGILASFRGQWRSAALAALAWAAIALLLVAGYAYRDDFARVGRRVLGELAPSRPIEGPAGEVVLRRGRDGHFHVDARIDGVPVRLLVDTGASRVALSAEDARRVGFAPERLAYDRPVATANGRAFAAAVTLGEVALGPLRVERVPALVMPEGAMTGSLLGMSFLDRLRAFAIEGDRLVLHGAAEER